MPFRFSRKKFKGSTQAVSLQPTEESQKILENENFEELLKKYFEYRQTSNRQNDSIYWVEVSEGLSTTKLQRFKRLQIEIELILFFCTIQGEKNPIYLISLLLLLLRQMLLLNFFKAKI